jgi:16S rRNA C967 or C1407 C5-methylase (RsmB/RsmF family)/NOL1/NOP2/fmu family ribosome biogenesis protein
MPQLPNAFLQNIQSLLKEESADFVKALDDTPSVSIRLNPQKWAKLTFPNTPVAWHKEGYYLAERPSFTLDPSFQAGAYYVQEASSMFIGHIITQLIDNQDNITALDLCAAPGGKTTLLASALPDDSFILANEVIKSRVDILKENITKWGYPNIYASNHDSEDFAALNGFFDIVLVDAPCSGEGLFRKDPKAIEEWSESAVLTCSARQKRILNNATQLVKPGGFLLYSTCTYNDIENIENAAYILQNADFQSVSVDIKPEWGIVEKKYGYQFYPHRLRGEGFYIAIFKNTKQENIGGVNKNNTNISLAKLPKKQIEAVSKWLQNPDKFDFFIKPNGQVVMVLKKHIPYISQLDKALKRKSMGIDIGEFKGSDFIPSHDLALSIAISKDTPSVSLTKTEALHYLKKENLDLPNAPQGWVVAQYEGLNLGWMKVLKNRINNYLPNEFRIKMDVPKE